MVLMGDSVNNKKIFILHYAFEKPVAAIIKNESNGSLYAAFTERNILLQLKPGDPVVIYYPDDTYSIKSGDIDYIINEEETVSIRLGEMTDMQMESRRRYKRYPASQFCDVKEIYTKKKGPAILKNISNQGLLLLSKNYFEVNDIVEASIYFGPATYFIEGRIVRVFEGKEYRGYGISVIADFSSMKNTREFMRAYQNEFIKNIDINLINQAYDMDLIFDSFEESNVSERLNNATLKFHEVLKKCR